MSLTFVIPVRHHETVPDWGVVQRQMAQTVRSISQQTVDDWHCVVVAQHDSPLPEMPDRVEVVRVDLPLLRLPDWDGGRGEAARNEAVRQDKGARVLAGLVAAPPSGHVMVVDYDDFVSNRLAEFAHRHREAPGWFVDSGYVYDEGPLVYLKTRGFNDLCGTSLIVNSRVLGLAGADTDPAHVRRVLGSHVFLVDDLAAAGTPLEPLPFPGAVYRVGVAGSVSGSLGVRRIFFRRRTLRDRPLTFVRRLANLRPTAGIAKEFAVPIGR